MTNSQRTRIQNSALFYGPEGAQQNPTLPFDLCFGLCDAAGRTNHIAIYDLGGGQTHSS